MQIIQFEDLPRHLHTIIRVRMENRVYQGKLTFYDGVKFNLGRCNMWLIHRGEHILIGNFRRVQFCRCQNYIIWELSDRNNQPEALAAGPLEVATIRSETEGTRMAFLHSTLPPFCYMLTHGPRAEASGVAPGPHQIQAEVAMDAQDRESRSDTITCHDERPPSPASVPQSPSEDSHLGNIPETITWGVFDDLVVLTPTPPSSEEP